MAAPQQTRAVRSHARACMKKVLRALDLQGQGFCQESSCPTASPGPFSLQFIKLSRLDHSGTNFLHGDYCFGSYSPWGY